VRVIEMAPVLGLLLLCLGLTVGGGPAMRYMEATTQALRTPQDYVTGVLNAPRGWIHQWGGKPMSRILPYPLLSAALLVLWLLLNQSLSVGHVILGSVIAVLASWAMAALRPEKPRIRRPGAALRLAGMVLVDILRSNIAVGRIIVRSREPGVNAGFMTIPLDLRSRQGLAVLSIIITSTPGTIWVEYDAAKGTLLLHVLDLVDKTVWVRTIKDRYERRLMEIFE
jgi:multicomponent K+:H+ antiporter subunit E